MSTSSVERNKRQAKVLEENYWDCSVCTYRNTAEAFKCLMCDVQKGTSTRKPRINPQLVAQQYNPTPPKTHRREGKDKSDKKDFDKSEKKNRRPPRLKNVDRSTAQTERVTVNNVTVMITEFKPKVPVDQSGASSSVSSEKDSQSETSSEPRSPMGTDSRSS